jgi:head-tail adaptor
MRGGTLSEWLVFEQRISESNPAGGTIETWLPDFEDWGEVQRLSELASRFIIRYRTFTEAGTEIAPNTHRILWHGRRWTITAAIADRRHSQYTIDCDGGDLVEVTYLESADREYLDGLTIMRPAAPPVLIDIGTAELGGMELGAVELGAVDTNT